MGGLNPSFRPDEPWQAIPRQAGERGFVTVALADGNDQDGAAAKLGAVLDAAVDGALEQWQSAHGGPEEQALCAIVRQAVPALVSGVAAELSALLAGDGSTVPGAVQRALWPVGRACVLAVWQLQGRGAVPSPEQRPDCPQCGRRMKLVAPCRVRHVLSRFGLYPLQRPYYRCEVCGGGLAPDDAAWGQGPGLLDPEVTQLLAANGCNGSFQDAVQTLEAHLFITVDDNEAERTTEAMGLVALRRSEERAEAGPCPLPRDPGSDVLLLEVDGGRVFAGGEWREPRLAAVAPLGPQIEVDADTGRERFVTGTARYTADIADADTFFQRDVRQLAEDAGLYHPRVRTVVCLSDGGGWIEPRWSTLQLPARTRVVSILDVRHFEEHVWTAAKAVWGDGHPMTSSWATRQIQAVRQRGPQTLIDTLARMRPRRAKGKDEVRKLSAYVARNADRLDYPTFVAERLPIGSGLIEGGIKAVINARAKAGGMRWSVPGARAVIRLRALARSGADVWADFWRTRPQLERPKAAELPSGGRKAA